MSKLFKIISCLIISLFIFAPQNSYALSNISISMNCDNLNPISTEEFTISFIVNSDVQTNISAYTFKVYFDNSKLSYKGLFSDTNNDDFKSFVSDGCITLLYVTSENGITINKNTDKNIFELNFKVLSTADLGITTITSFASGLCNYDAIEIPAPDISPVDINISQSEAGNCDLSYLEADGYQLSPVFSADITNYYVEVPYSKNTIEFTAITADPDATVKTSRKTLKRAGTSTDIKLTVVSADKKSRKIYTVTVNRLSKEETDSKLNSNKFNDDFGSDDFDLNDSSLTSNADELANANNIALQNDADPLVVKESCFNFIWFVIISLVFVTAAIFIIKNKKHN